MHDIFEEIVFRLQPGAVDCDADGLRVAGHDLLNRRHSAALPPTFSIAPTAVLEERLRRFYRCNISAAGKIYGLQVVADALNAGEVARAQIAALLLKLPDPVEAMSSSRALAKRLHDCGWLDREWDPDKHPRTGAPPNPGWFAPTDGGEGAVNDDAKPTSRTAGGASEQHVAVLTRNFKYACRVLELEPDAASEILHQLKRAHGLGGDDNCTSDTETGEVYFNGESIGNLGE